MNSVERGETEKKNESEGIEPREKEREIERKERRRRK